LKELQAPWLSIITVCYNDGLNLEKTVKSIRGQHLSDLQSIVVDGGSSDNTSDVIKANLDVITDWVSEKDNGIYDAMNKGLTMAKGKYILFLNAGDLFHSQEVLTRVKYLARDEDILYGNSVVVNEDGSPKSDYHKITPTNLTWRDFRYGMVVNHQAIFAKKSIAASYDLQYKISSDIDWAIRTVKQANKIKNLQMIVCDFQAGGISSQKRMLALRERWKILQNHFGIIQTFLSHSSIVIQNLKRLF
jgi:glycosyltransferase involved in cell wall biosynthesis